MEQIDIQQALAKGVICHGALDFDELKNGLGPRRLPAWTRHQVPRLMDVIVRMPSGVRLVFETDATEISVSALATNLVTPPAIRRAIVMDLVTEGKTFSVSSTAGNTILLDMANPDNVQMDRGEPGEWTFRDLPAGIKKCEIWLPHNAMVELRSLSFNTGAILRETAADERPRWLHHGSSISHCLEAEQPSLIWPAVAAEKLGWCLQNLGFGGQCQLDPFVARTMAQSDADIISIKTGINIINGDTMRERIFLPLLHGFLDTIRERKPDVPIFLISPIYCPSAESHPGPTVPVDGKFVVIPGHEAIRNGSLTLQRVRALMAQLVAIRRDKQLYYLDGTTLFGETDIEDLPDHLHPNPAGYIRMGERFSNEISAILTDQAREHGDLFTYH